MRRRQKTGQTGCPGEGAVKTENSRGAQSTATLETTEKDGADSLLEKILHSVSFACIFTKNTIETLKALKTKDYLNYHRYSLAFVSKISTIIS